MVINISNTKVNVAYRQYNRRIGIKRYFIGRFIFSPKKINTMQGDFLIL